MFYRVQIALVFMAPIILLAGLYALGQTITVPHLGREYVTRIELPEPGSAVVGLPEIRGPDDPSRPLVVIDAGHGGHDPGASGAGYREKALVLNLARQLREELLEGGGIRVALTREDDTFLTLSERVAIGRQLGADLFLSIHADSAGEKDSVSGASVYTLSNEASSEAAARFAARENAADRINGVQLSGQSESVSAILVELSQRRTSDSSAEFARLIEREGAETLQFHPQAQRSASLAVLRAPDVPSVLFEAGFVTNPEEVERLASLQGQSDFAEAVARAIRIYFARVSGADAGAG